MTSQIIGISGNSGAGKSTLAQKLAEDLDATIIVWDDFDDISTGPDDYVDWYRRGEDHSEWDYPALAEVLSELKLGNTIVHPAFKNVLTPKPFIIFDAPLGRMHEQTGSYIDFWVHISVPLDVALARRLIRDFKTTDKTKEELIKELEYYIKSTRALYFDDIYKEGADFVIDGMLLLADQVSKIITRIIN